MMSSSSSSSSELFGVDDRRGDVPRFSSSDSSEELLSLVDLKLSLDRTELARLCLSDLDEQRDRTDWLRDRGVRDADGSA